ncbi:MAG TPA: hypothetical protein VLA88_03765 [Candidatus Saccharimonadales bacterium]|nr:hypothetical protein [Candidatus Saccharimonadales bacterium]
MIFQNNPTVALHVTREGLTGYTKSGKNGHSQKLSFPPEVVRNLEVVDQPQLAKLVATFAAENKLHGQRVVILLDDSVIFQKIVPAAEEIKQPGVVADFEHKVPFDPEKRRVITLHPKDQLVILGTNRVLYETIATALQTVGAKVLAAAPMAIYGKGKGGQLNRETLAPVLNDTRRAEAANFLHVN